ncbi:hypothetical protein IV58_GL000161 [Lactobacillus delbrueckii subsp. jakobsenii ZN7a-9 = DSM 26046]|uniref:hypothetical protein n=1 Tax=Lactobacillus delbrueckii TaxID=1584 RepID=UPI00032F4D09|nr:hypothetical protein [Lactobacillus delbrueckii]EOD02444.1 hypothetical protein B506_06604 [Lactobacillus delbrueckii subsp. jakobsenii ZN7a-9 = DSM 26046]KRO18991.1 hypothetical protein IV58_GL000161 [Lactobacillus delbrueckii subsp. jakobsenii ZN7a-9 = DSM 26046]TDG63320.1 hypothetical protein C5L19_000104 [Lactobacillus delbrueckii subsp. jakobsenii]
MKMKHAKRIALLLVLGYAGGQALKRSAPFLKGVQAGILMEKGRESSRRANLSRNLRN